MSAMIGTSHDIPMRAPVRETIGKVVFLSAVFLLALSRIEDPDAWLHLMNGKVIWTLRQMPSTESYVYSMQDQPYLYTSWFFGVLYYLTSRFTGITGVILLKAGIITVVFFLMLKMSLRPHRNLVVSIVVLFLVALITRHRFTERPDTVFFIVVSFSVFALDSFVSGDKRFLYLLPFVHLLWANVHTSIALMFLPFFAYAAGSVLQRYFPDRESMPGRQQAGQLKTILLVCLFSFLASLVNPYGIHQYTLGAGFLNNPWFRQNIGEMAPPDWARDKEFYWWIALAIFSFMVNGRRFRTVDALLVLPVLVLAFTSRRFMYLFFIVASPVVARNFSSFVSTISARNGALVKNFIMAGVVLLIVLTTSLTLANVSPFGNLDKQFGFGVNETFVPEGALRYMDARKIEGRILNSFYWGQYIAWRDYPKRSVIIDGRCNVPPQLLSKLTRAPGDPAVLDELYRAYRFEAILIDYYYDEEGTGNLVPGYDARLQHPDWALVYWDDNSSLYLRRNGPYAPVVRKDEYRIVKPANNLRYLIGLFREGKDAARILHELERNTATTNSISANIYLGTIYSLLGRYREAIGCFSQVRDHPLKHYLFFAQKGAAYAYEVLGDRVSALDFYKKSYRQLKDPPIREKIKALSR